MEKVSSRTKDFRIGCFHGKPDPEDGSIEARLRNELFLIGMLRMQITRAESRSIRLVAYELPLQTGRPRGQCIDLLGYDENKVPWIIELKKSTSRERLGEVVKQIRRYDGLLSGVRGGGPY